MKKMFKLEGLDCAHCASKIEESVVKVEGVKTATVNFMTTKLTVEAEDGIFDSILENVKKVINNIEPNIKIMKA